MDTPPKRPRLLTWRKGLTNEQSPAVELEREPIVSLRGLVEAELRRTDVTRTASIPPRSAG